MELNSPSEQPTTGATTHYDIIIPGVYFCDVIFTGLPDFPSLGAELFAHEVAVVPGGDLNTIIALNRLGVKVGWTGTVGVDFFSHYIMHLIDDEGIDRSLLIQRDHPQQRVTVSLSYPQDRAFITYADGDLPSLDLILHALERATTQHIHFGSLDLDERIPDVFKAYRAQGIALSMDCQHHSLTLGDSRVKAVLSSIDIFMPNAVEAMRLTGKDTADGALRILTDLIPCVVIKNGSRGVVGCKSGDYHEIPAMELKHVLDTTGAGDVFNAGFLAAHLRGLSMRDCLRWGNYCGGMSTQGYGGTRTAPTLQQVEAWYSTSPLG
jgi:sugar/nucleoside kinase (ribokinase family)